MKKVFASALLSLSLLGAGPSMAADTNMPSPKSMALQCAVLYGMMVGDNAPHERSNSMLSDQAIIMGTIYAIIEDGQNPGKAGENFATARDMVERNLITQYQLDSNKVVDRLIQCEGWREEVIIFVSTETRDLEDPNDNAAIQEIFSSVPGPKASYPLKGVSRLDVTLAVDKAFAKFQ